LESIYNICGTSQQIGVAIKCQRIRTKQ
jgi:hypothetical protein